jgi:signal transduction histidine kinase
MRGIVTDLTTQPSKRTVDEQMDLERRARLLQIMTVTGIIVCALFLFLMLLPTFGSQWPYLVIFGVLLCSCVLSTFLNRRGYLRTAGYLFLLSLSLAIFGIILAGVLYERVFGFAIYYLTLPVLAAGMVLGARATFGLATVNAVLILFLSVVAYFTLELDAQAYGDDVLAVAVPALILCYLMALVAWLYGNSLEGALRRVTEQSQQLKQANIEIQAFSRGLEDKVEERTHELREFVSMVAHDLRNPLTVIRGYTEILQEEQESPPNRRQVRALETISANIEHMLQMTEKLLELSRLQSGTVRFDMEPLPIEVVIDEVCTSFEQQLLDKQLGLKREVATDLPRIWGDHFHLTQVLNNLVTNAYNYTPSGAIIIGARRRDGFVEVSVSDTGIGISPEDQQRLFTHFFRGQHDLVRSRKGTGLGLSIARSIVEAHGGEIWVESEVGRGSTFRFTVPQVPKEQA